MYSFGVDTCEYHKYPWKVFLWISHQNLLNLILISFPLKSKRSICYPPVIVDDVVVEVRVVAVVLFCIVTSCRSCDHQITVLCIIQLHLQSYKNKHYHWFLLTLITNRIPPTNCSMWSLYTLVVKVLDFLTPFYILSKCKCYHLERNSPMIVQ